MGGTGSGCIVTSPHSAGRYLISYLKGNNPKCCSYDHLECLFSFGCFFFTLSHTNLRYISLQEGAGLVGQPRTELSTEVELLAGSEQARAGAKLLVNPWLVTRLHYKLGDVRL